MAVMRELYGLQHLVIGAVQGFAWRMQILHFYFVELSF